MNFTLASSNKKDRLEIFFYKNVVPSVASEQRLANIRLARDRALIEREEILCLSAYVGVIPKIEKIATVQEMQVKLENTDWIRSDCVATYCRGICNTKTGEMFYCPIEDHDAAE